LLIRWEFAENEYFENSVLEKRFWYRRSRDGWSGFVSEPVPIQWRKGKDLTGGLLDLVCNAWESEKQALEKDRNWKMRRSGLTEKQKALKKKIDQTGMGGLSFFAWFGFIGRRVSEKESAEAMAKEAERREARRNGKSAGSPPFEEEDDGEEDIVKNLEIFPDGDDLAVAITEDLWPGAIKYFSELISFCYFRAPLPSFSLPFLSLPSLSFPFPSSFFPPPSF
jgi:Nucleosome assembly protein (NAP)